jgi:transcriptional regulator with XRE-family HTH domain
MQQSMQTAPGDLSRRIFHRRRELGLSVEELAEQAGVDPGYLRYFEGSSQARLSVGTLEMVARALRTSPSVLLGGDVDRPEGHGGAAQNATLEELTEQQSRTHLGAGGVGRIVFLAPRGPVALPVNYRYVAGEIVLKTNVSVSTTLVAQKAVGFEVDRVDEAMSEGWSVVISGPAHRFEDPSVVVELSPLDLEPWAGGNRGVLVAIAPREITGRRIVHHVQSDQ